jgi:hypothetical protein
MIIKKILMLSFIALIGFGATAQDLDRFYACLDRNSAVQNLIQQKQTGFAELKLRIGGNVQQLIDEEKILNEDGVLSFENLSSIVNTADKLEKLDQEYAAHYASALKLIINESWTRHFCSDGFEEASYKESFLDYLEDSHFTSIENYASVEFSNRLNFKSALLSVNSQEAQWLNSPSSDEGSENPAFNQTFENEFYWSVLSPDFDINLRNPEPELVQKANQLSGKNGGKKSIKEVITIVMEIFTAVKEIFQWLTNDVFNDCYKSTKASIKNYMLVPSSFSSDVQRKIVYKVGQNGMLFDLKQTTTRVFAKARIYKRKRGHWKKDSYTPFAIGSCLKEWDPCNDVPFPNDGSVLKNRADNHYFKTKLLEAHPFALITGRNADEFLSFPIFYDGAYMSTIQVLNRVNCY